MSFSDFKTISQVQTEYQVKYDEVGFIQKVKADISKQFLSEMEFNIKMLGDEVTIRKGVFPIYKEKLQIEGVEFIGRYSQGDYKVKVEDIIGR